MKITLYSDICREAAEQGRRTVTGYDAGMPKESVTRRAAPDREQRYLAALVVASDLLPRALGGSLSEKDGEKLRASCATIYQYLAKPAIKEGVVR